MQSVHVYAPVCTDVQYLWLHVYKLLYSTCVLVYTLMHFILCVKPPH